MYKEQNLNEVYITRKAKNNNEMPCLKDVLNNVKNKKLYNKLKLVIEKYYTFSNYSNITFFNSIVFDTSNLDTEDMEVVSYYLLKLFGN